MKILQISPQFPFPLDSGGKNGIYNITRQLSRFGAEIFFVAFSRFPLPEDYLHHFKTFCYPYVILENTANTFPKIVKYFIVNKPIFVEKYFTKKAKTFFSDLLKDIDFDIIHLDHTAMFSVGKWISERTSKPVGLRLHNIEWLIWKRYLDEQKKYSPKRIFLRQQTELLRKVEAEAIRYANVSFTCTEEDRQRALELAPKSKVYVAPPGVDLSLWELDPRIERNPFEIVFATTYQWQPNVDGLKWYLDNVHPLVISEEPRAKLTILGKNPPEFCKKYRNVDIIGYVPKVQPYYNRATVFVVPLFVASGVRMRIFEAMAMALPVVSTKVGAEGIDADENFGLFICDDPKDFANKLLELLKDTDRARIYGSRAREFVEKNFSIEKTIRIIFEQYKQLVTKNT
ncbi:MAG: glycosyltransferase family 4 protein [Ignavibacteria bacterium]|nr:glycosyltransferase family 4 protein [Ignavibacteria bacterium]